MAVEADFYNYDSGIAYQELEDTVHPGAFRNYQKSPGVRLFVTRDNSRSVFELSESSNVYAIRYRGEEDEEGEIVDLSAKIIELTVGEELCIMKNSSDTETAREMWFLHTEEDDMDYLSSGLEIPIIEYSKV